MRIAVVVAHADDESLGMGATLARLAAEGHTLAAYTLTDGVGARPSATVQQAERRRQEHLAARGVLGVASGGGFTFPDNALDTSGVLAVARVVEAFLGGWEPEVVYTHHAGDLNVDHRIVHQAVVTATRPQPGQTVRRVLAFEVPSSTEWAFGATGPPFCPNVFVPLSPVVMEQKRAALACYASELRPAPHPRSWPVVEALARVRGAQCGHEYAEAFQLVREVGAVGAVGEVVAP